MTTNRQGFYVTGGTLRRDAPSYVVRRADGQLYDALKQGKFCYVLTARQMGKSSLMVRTAARIREEGVGVAVLDLTAVGQNLTAEQWYGGLLSQIGQQLDLEQELEQFWDSNSKVGSLQRWMRAFRRVILTRYVGPVIIFIDEIDSVRSLPFSTDEFLAGIREFYNYRAEDPELQRLTFCLLGVASPSDLIRDARTTPFNIGQRIELHDFTEEEATQLAEGLEREETLARRLLKRVSYWTRGHPYLTQRLCHAIAADPTVRSAKGVDLHCEQLFFSQNARERDDNLLFVRERMVHSDVDLAGLLTLYENVRSGKQVRDDETNPLVTVLRLSGITRIEKGHLRLRNRIYQRVFDRKWILENIPGAELRRQQTAFRRGVVRATLGWSSVLLALAALTLTAVNQARRASRAEQDAKEKLWGSYLAEARASRWSGQAGRRFESLEALSNAAAMRASVELRNEAIACMALADLQSARRWGLPRGTISVSFDASLQRYVFSDAQGNLSLRMVTDDQELLRLPGFGIKAVILQFSLDGRFLAVKYHLNDLVHFYVWDITRREAILRIPDGVHDGAMEFSPDNRSVVAGKSDGTVHLYGLSSGKESKRLFSGPPAYHLRFDPTGRRLAISSRHSSTVQIRDKETGTIIAGFEHPGLVRGIAWSRGGELLATACADFRVYVWNISTGKTQSVLEGHQAEATSVVFNHKGDLLASTGWDSTTRLWEPWTGRLLVTTSDIATRFSSDDRFLAFHTIRQSGAGIWRVASGQECRTFYDLDDPKYKEPLSVDFHPDGRILASSGNPGVRLWDLQTARESGFLPIGLTWSALFHPANGSLVTSGIQGLHRWPIEISPDMVHIGPPTALGTTKGLGRASLSADGQTIAVNVRGDYLLVLNPQGQHVAIDGHPGINEVAVSPDGLWVATGTWQATDVKIWDARKGTLVRNLPIDRPATVCFSPDGRWVVAATNEAYRLWQTASWRSSEWISLGDVGGPAAITCFTRDGKMLAVGSRYQVRLIDPDRMRQLAILEAPDPRPLKWLCFSRDGTRLAVATENHRIQLWDLRVIREQLAEMKLDWDLPPFPARKSQPDVKALKVEVLLGDLGKAASGVARRR